MSEPVRYAIHIRRLLQIKKRPNQFPTYQYKNKESQKLHKSKSQKMKDITSEIKSNRQNIINVKKSFSKKKPPDYFEDKYLYEKEVENVQKQLLDSLIIQNKKLRQKLQVMRNNINFSFRIPRKVEILKDFY